MEIITSRDIKGKNTTNMGAYLKGLKGIDFTSSGINNYSISVRGFNSSFNTRLLTLSDGRVANIPALRVINYSTIPQSMDDVDKIEIIMAVENGQPQLFVEKRDDWIEPLKEVIYKYS